MRRSFLLASLLLMAPLAWGRPSLDSDRLDQLARYDVLVFGDPAGGGLERGKAIGVFDATPEEVFRVASDYDKWKDYLPKVRDSHVIERAGNQALVETVAQLPWPIGDSTVDATYVHEKLPGEVYRIRFEMVRGSMKHYLGSIYIEPWSVPGKAAVTYELVAEPDFLAPKGKVNKMVLRSASGFVHALRQRINELHRLGFLHPLPSPAPTPSPSPQPLGTTTVKR